MPDTTTLETKNASLSSHKSPITIGLLGLGTVGTGVYKLLARFPQTAISKIAVKNLDKQRSLSQIPPNTLTAHAEDVIKDPNIDIIVELIGGKEYPYQLIRQALESGKHVVTANKVVIAHYGPELFALAAEKGVNLFFEAAVAGGIPIVLPLKTSLAGNQIQQIAGILNGTTNYILTRMEQAGLDFQAALKEAQAKGFAEADPTADIEGHDAACKISILGSIAYNAYLPQPAVYTEGISNIGAADIEMARTFGYTIKLIALAKGCENNAVDLRVHPMLVPSEHPLAKVAYENNAIWVQGDAVGDVMFYGKGAGELPTASAVVGDILFMTQALQSGQSYLAGMDFSLPGQGSIRPIADTTNAYYIRLEAEDQPGVLGHLGQACGDHNVSLDAIMQKGTHPETKTATIVLLTHEVQEADLQAALKTMQAQSSTKRIHTVLRVFQP